MNLENINSQTKRALIEGNEQIAFIVYHGEYYWVIDWGEHFNLNHTKNIDSLCQSKELMSFLPEGETVDGYRRKLIQRYREGIPILTDSLLPDYLNSRSTKVVSTKLLNLVFFSNDVTGLRELSFTIEQYLSFGTSISEVLRQRISQCSAMLPKFYINYDRKIFMHMVSGRYFENAVLDGWWGACADFEHMIPTSHRYWLRGMDEDFWAVTNIFRG